MTFSVVGTFTVLYACALAVGALFRAVLGLGPGTACVGGAVLLELTLVARAVLGAWAMAVGAPLAEPVVHAGYLVTSVVLLPLLVIVGRTPGRRSSTAVDAAVLAVGCAAVAVVGFRLELTGHPA